MKVIRSFEESTLSGDKGVSPIAPIYGRGVSVVAKVSVPEKVINSVLRTDSVGMLQWHDLIKDIVNIIIYRLHGLIKHTELFYVYPLLKIEQFSVFYETIDNDDYSENIFYSLNNPISKFHFLPYSYCI